MEQENRPPEAAEHFKQIARNLEETQIVSLQDLEELEYLQLTEENKTRPAARRLSVSLLWVVLCLLLLVVAGTLTAAYVHSKASNSAGRTVQTGRGK